MKMKELVSVIIPVYQSESTIERCVLSLINGTYQNIQIILVEDCSSDESRIKCELLAEKYSQVQSILNEQNRGVSYTRNQGLKAANGKYLMFVDSDDWVEPTFVEMMVDYHEKNEVSIPVCAFMRHNETKGEETSIWGWDDITKDAEISIMEGILILNNRELLKIIWNKLFLLDTIKGHNIQFQENMDVGEDFRFLLDYLECCQEKNFYFINIPLYHYHRDNQHSLATTFWKTNVDDILYDLRRMYMLSGLSGEQLDTKMESMKQQQLQNYAYGIMHCSSLSGTDKKKMIYSLSEKYGKQLYKNNKWLMFKERLKRI